MSRTIVIADLHGCLEEALALLPLVQAREQDRVIFVGDLVDRGPHPRECVELAMRHECVLGNHEEKHLQQRHRAPERLSPDHLRTREALNDTHFAWMATLPRFVRLPEHGAAVVHAGVLPGRPLEQQEDRHLLHAQHLALPEPKSYWPSKAPAHARFWTNDWRGPERLIFGHTVMERPLVTPWAVGLDTGAVFGGGLTAVVLPSWELVTVPSRSPRNLDARPPHYELQDGVRAFS